MQNHKQIVLDIYASARCWLAVPSNRHQIQFLPKGGNPAFNEHYIKISGRHKTEDLAWKSAAKPLKLKHKNFILAKGKPEIKVLIWSGEHLAFWRSDAKGYTLERSEAGIYTAAKAWELTVTCGTEKLIKFIC